ncbi:MAG: helix-turn-helix transcriptional regulator [Nitrospinae bacterium]|nr:helix-turn-helix transcriptional regulator [Nitrospinota bacterium]
MNWKEHKAELLRDPRFREAYEELRPDVELVQSLMTLRLQRRLTQKQLAERIGTKQPAIARLESLAYGRASLSLLKRIAKALGASLVVRFEPLARPEAQIPLKTQGQCPRSPPPHRKSSLPARDINQVI